jgi:hypothetical protein
MLNIDGLSIVDGFCVFRTTGRDSRCWRCVQSQPKAEMLKKVVSYNLRP